MAVKAASEKTVRILIDYFKNNHSEKKKGRINQQNNDSANAIDLAVQKHLTDIGVLLVENGGMQSLPRAMQQQLKKRTIIIQHVKKQSKKLKLPIDDLVAAKIGDMLGNHYRNRSTLLF